MQDEENKMGICPIKRLIITMSLPMICSMLVQALYNVTDSIFVSRVSEEALTAVSLVFPVQNFMTAVGTGIGVGMNAVLSRLLGEKRNKDAGLSAWYGLLFSIAGMLLFVIFGIFGSGLYFRFQTTNRGVVSAGVSYNRICCCLSVGAFMQMYFERLLQSTGKTVYSMWVQGIGSVTNIVLDPILIFGYGGFPAMGVKGAAIATVIGQTIAAMLGFYFHHTKNTEVRIKRYKSKEVKQIYQNIVSIGIPAIIMQSLASIMVYGVNLILIRFTVTATAVFGVYYKLQSFAFMPLFGLSNAMIPVIAYNLGAKNKERINETIKLSFVYVTGIMIVCTMLFQLFPNQLLALFDPSSEMKRMGYIALKILSCNFIFAGVSVVLSAVFQAIGKSTYSMWVSIFRQLIILLPAAYLLSMTGKLEYVWWSYPIAAIGSAIISVVLFLEGRKVYETI